MWFWSLFAGCVGWLMRICTGSVEVLCQLCIPCLHPPWICCSSSSLWLPPPLSSLASWPGLESTSCTEGPQPILFLSKGSSKTELLVFSCRFAPPQFSPCRKWSLHTPVALAKTTEASLGSFPSQATSKNPVSVTFKILPVPKFYPSAAVSPVSTSAASPLDVS